VKKQLREELKRFNQIINYDLGGERVIKEDTDIETEVSFVPAEIDYLIEDLSEVTPISKDRHTINSATLIQAILVDSGYCVHGKTCDYIDGDFGGTTAKSLKKFIGKTSLKNDDLETLENEMVKKAVEEDKSYVGTKEKAEKSKKDLYEKMGIHLEYLTPKMAKYFRKYFRDNKKLKVTGEDPEEDIINYIVKKEGGLTDTGTDRAKTKNLKDWFNTETQILKKSGKNYKLNAPNLEPTLSKYYKKKNGIKTYNSDHWHTNKGIVYKYYNTNMNGNNSIDTIENWFNLDKEDVRQYYLDFYFDNVKNYSSYPIINHFFAIVQWGSGTGPSGPKALKTKLLAKTKSKTIDEAIEKIGLPAFFDLMTKERGKQFLNIGDKANERGWMNSLVNFHYYFYDKYMKPIADQVDDETSEEIIDVINTPEAESEIELVMDLPEVPVVRQGGETWFDLEDFKSKQDTILKNYWGNKINIKKGDFVPPDLRRDDDDF
jgi:hypothetical protein